MIPDIVYNKIYWYIWWKIQQKVCKEYNQNERDKHYIYNYRNLEYGYDNKIYKIEGFMTIGKLPSNYYCNYINYEDYCRKYISYIIEDE